MERNKLVLKTEETDLLGIETDKKTEPENTAITFDEEILKQYNGNN